MKLPRHAWATIPLAFALAAGLRYGLVEPASLAHLCGATGAPWWCALRALAVAVVATGALGVAAVGAGVVATLTRRSGWAIGAVACGAAGLVLYAVVAGATGLLLGLLVLARTAGRPPPDARGERER